MKKATSEQTKIHNRSLILKTIYQQGQISRADIARATRLTRPTVSSAVADLIDECLVKEVGYGPSEGGKPPILLSVIDDSRHLIGIDLAESEFQGGVVDLRGNLIHRSSVSVSGYNGRVPLELVYRLIDELVPAAASPLLGIGIGTPGLIDARRGVVRYAVNLDWRDLSLRDLLEKRYSLPVYVANDSHVAALGEYTFGHGQATPNLVVIKVGRGISAGIVLDGHLYYGDGSGAGEIGHVMMVEGGEPCRCGHFGCLETVASSRAIVRRAKAIARNNPHHALHRLAETPAAINIDTVLQAFEAGDETLRQIIAEAGHYLGVAVASLVGTLNIHRILIAGMMTCFGEALLEPIRREMRQRAMAMLVNGTQVGLSSLGKDIVIQGAAALLLANELGLV